MTGKPATRRRRPTREYSRSFASDPGTTQQLQFRVPTDLYAAVRKKAEKDGTSVRSLVLSFLKDWSES